MISNLIASENFVLTRCNLYFILVSTISNHSSNGSSLSLGLDPRIFLPIEYISNMHSWFGPSRGEMYLERERANIIEDAKD